MLEAAPPDSYDVAILALFVRRSAIRKGNVDVPAEQAALADQLFQNCASQ